MKIFKEIMSYLIIILVVVLIRTFIITPVRVDGLSMWPTLNNNDILLLKKYDKKIDRFDIVVVNYYDSKLVKRVIGLPGESVKIKNNILYVNDVATSDIDLSVITADFSISDLGYDVIPDNYYFVLGDNRNKSTDSRIIGLIKKDDIVGITNFRIFPFNKIGVFN